MYFVYILASRSKTLYIGVTNSLIRRIQEHKDKRHDGYTAKYNIDRLVYFEQFAYIDNAIVREKQLKTWLRHKKIELIQTSNPTWEDLFFQFNQPIPPPSKSCLNLPQIIGSRRNKKPCHPRAKRRICCCFCLSLSPLPT